MNRSLSIATLLAAAALSAHAGLMGTNVTLNYNFSGSTSTDIITVTPATEVTCTGGGTGNANICGILTGPDQFLDFDDFTITYNYVQNGDLAYFLAEDPNGFDFQDLNFTNGIANVFITSTIAGLDQSRVTFNANSIQVNMYDLPLGCEDTFQLTVVTNPEPSAGLLAGLGVALLGIPRFLKRRKS